MKKNFILIWEVDDYPDNGGGTYHLTFESLKEVEEKINELFDDNRVKVSDSVCYELKDELRIVPVVKVTRFEIMH